MDKWSLTWVRSAALYTGPIQNAIQALKYQGEQEIAGPLARYMVVALHQEPWVSLDRAIDFAIPVPLHESRKKERGYNQAQLLAEALGRQIHLPVESSLLTRTRFSESQVNLQFDERQANVKDAFQTQANLASKTILLIDDVYTTGATLNECAKALCSAGATDVYGLTIAMPSK